MFRVATPEDRETGKEFTAQSSGYFDRWPEIAKTGDAVESLKDTMVSEQFLCKRHKKFVVLSKKRYCKTLVSLATTADRFLES